VKLADATLALVSAFNAVCCLAVLLLAIYKRVLDSRALPTRSASAGAQLMAFMVQEIEGEHGEVVMALAIADGCLQGPKIRVAFAGREDELGSRFPTLIVGRSRRICIGGRLTR
jgi:hypothetical protein